MAILTTIQWPPVKQGLRALGLAIVAALLLAACTREEEPNPRTVGVELNEWAVALSAPEAPSGEIKFLIRNRGAIAHEFLVLKTDLEPGKLPVKGFVVDEEAAGEVVGELEDDRLLAGKATSLELHLKPGRYAIVCNIPQHYQAGMRAAFRVR